MSKLEQAVAIEQLVTKLSSMVTDVAIPLGLILKVLVTMLIEL